MGEKGVECASEDLFLMICGDFGGQEFPLLLLVVISAPGIPHCVETSLRQHLHCLDKALIPREFSNFVLLESPECSLSQALLLVL
jgi:hypothetical protein